MASLRDAEAWGRRPGVSSRSALLNPRLMAGNPLGCFALGALLTKPCVGGLPANRRAIGEVARPVRGPGLQPVGRVPQPGARHPFSPDNNQKGLGKIAVAESGSSAILQTVNATIQTEMIQLADGSRVLRLSEPASGLSLEKKLDAARPVVRQKDWLMKEFAALLEHEAAANAA